MADTTDQVRTPPNPTGKGGFGDNPENRNPGGWKKDATARYKLEQIIQMSDEELQGLIDNEEAAAFDKRLAHAVKNGQWRELEGMINQVYGKPKESVDLTTKGKSLNPYSNLSTEELRKLAGKNDTSRSPKSSDD